MNGKFYENNIVIQYDKDLIEVWDEAKRLRCEWYNDYEKGITKPPIRVSDIEVVELNFRGDNVDCWMEIQHGKGPWASLVNGIVPLGTTLTMVIGIKDKQREFDMRVKSCSANAENSSPIQLSDEYGCVLRPKMISKFMKISGTDSRASVITYAFFYAFKFPDSMSVSIKCKVEICRFGCPNHCQKPQNYEARETNVSVVLNLPSINSHHEVKNKQTRSQKRVFQKQVVKNQKLLKSHFPFLQRKLRITENPSNIPEFNQNTTKMMQRTFEKLSYKSTKETRKKRSLDELGVNSGYTVLSKDDLSFKKDFEKGIGVTVFQGRIEPEVFFGVCFPSTGLSVFFVVMSILAIVSVIVLGLLCYKKFLQKIL